MNDDELAAVVRDMRVAAANVIGFHDLAESDPPPPPAERIRYEAQAYAQGVALARHVARLSRLIRER